MDTAISPFGGAAAFYSRYRREYPPAVFDGLADRLGLDGSQRGLDLGCGPGMATFGLARLVGRVVAVDAEADMVAEGRRLAACRGVDNIDWLVGRAEDLVDLPVGEVDVVTVAAAFHWMDRPAVLELLDKLVRPGGAVAVVTGSISGTGDDIPDRPGWVDAVVDVRRRWLRSRRRWRGDHGDVRKTYSNVRQEQHGIVRESAFSATETFEVRWQREHDVESLVGPQMTMPDSTPDALGVRAVEFRADLRRALLAVEPSGVFVEPIRTEVLIGRRPGQVRR